MVPVRSCFIFFGSSLSTNMIFCCLEIYFLLIISQSYDSLGLKCPSSEGKSFLGCSDFCISHSIDGFWLGVSKLLLIPLFIKFHGNTVMLFCLVYGCSGRVEELGQTCEWDSLTFCTAPRSITNYVMRLKLNSILSALCPAVL